MTAPFRLESTKCARLGKMNSKGVRKHKDTKVPLVEAFSYGALRTTLRTDNEVQEMNAVGKEPRLRSAVSPLDLFSSVSRTGWPPVAGIRIW